MKTFFTYFIFLITLFAFSQIDKGNKSFKMGGILPKITYKLEEKPKPIEPKKPEKPNIPTFEELMKQENQSSNPFDKKEKGIVLLQESTVEKRIDNKELSYQELDQNIDKKQFQRDRDFGKLYSDTQQIYLSCRDYGMIDSDFIAIVLNGEYVTKKVFLDGSFTSFKVKLNVGINSLEFIALNTGSSFPNTVEFVIEDFNKKEIIANASGVATDYRTKFSIIYDGEEEK